MLIKEQTFRQQGDVYKAVYKSKAVIAKKFKASDRPGAIPPEKAYANELEVLRHVSLP
jgi:hypothetical protein